MKPWMFLFTFLYCSYCDAQVAIERYWGVQAAFMVNIGTHRLGFGLKFNSYLACNNAQLNLGTAYRYYAHNLGNRAGFGEWRHTAGIVLMAGKRYNPINFNFEGALHQSEKPFALGYAHLWYKDRVGTSQRSGTWNLGMRHVDIQFENDVFGGQAKDRFRTGNLTVTYRTETRSLAMGLLIWTGETRNSIWDKTPRDRCPSGFRDLTPLPYGKTSHGVLYLSGQQVITNGQIAQIQVGWDSEQIRHVFQNRLIHDLIFLPKGIERNTPHYPRKGPNGENVFDRKSIRKDLPFYQVGINDLFLY